MNALKALFGETGIRLNIQQHESKIRCLRRKMRSYLHVLAFAVLCSGCVSLRPAASKVEFMTVQLQAREGGVLMEVPAWFEVLKDEGPDFDVFTVRSMSDPESWLGVYIGRQPSQRHLLNTHPGIIRDRIGQQVVGWLRQPQPPPAAEGTYRHDVYVKGLFDRHPRESARDLIVHIWARGDLRHFERLRRLPRTLRLAPQLSDDSTLGSPAPDPAE